MTTIVTVASGKGGVGKSVAVANLGLALAALGRKVVLADLDVGGSNLSTLFGVFEEGPDLGAFLSREIECLEDAARPIWKNLSLVVGAGETLATANPNWGMKQRLLRHLLKLDAEIVLVDLGAGTGPHALDFFNAGHLRIVVTVPEPTASVDAYRLIKLAAVREAVVRVHSRNPVRRSIERRDFSAAGDLWTLLDSTGASRSDAPAASTPWLLSNRTGGTDAHFQRLHSVAKRFLGCELRSLGRIPEDPWVPDSVRRYLPVVEYRPSAPASRAYRTAAGRLAALVDRADPGREPLLSSDPTPRATPGA